MSVPHTKIYIIIYSCSQASLRAKQLPWAGSMLSILWLVYGIVASLDWDGLNMFARLHLLARQSLLENVVYILERVTVLAGANIQGSST